MAQRNHGSPRREEPTEGARQYVKPKVTKYPSLQHVTKQTYYYYVYYYGS